MSIETAIQILRIDGAAVGKVVIDREFDYGCETFIGVSCDLGGVEHHFPFRLSNEELVGLDDDAIGQVVRAMLASTIAAAIRAARGKEATEPQSTE